MSGLQWMNDLIYLGFTSVLLASAIVLSAAGGVALRPLIGVTAVLPAALIASGLVRALWALRLRTGIGWKRAILAFANWLSVSWVVALACVQGLGRGRGVFMRTPKTAERRDPFSAIWTARSETTLAALLWGAAVFTLVSDRATPLLLGLLVWQGSVYASAPMMSPLNARTRLTPELERRRRTEVMRERFTRAVPYVAGAAATVMVLLLVGFIIGVGGSHPGPEAQNPFVVTRAAPGAGTPLGDLIGATPTPTTTGSPSPSPSSSASPTPSPSASPSASPSPSPSPSPSASASAAASP